MVYIMKIYVDGGCRHNGKPHAIGAAAAVFKLRWRRRKKWSMVLPRDPTPTNQRTEISAIILALEQALERYHGLRSEPRIKVTIYSDSQYAVGCMTKWVEKWR